MAADIDSLQIEITASADEAAKKIKSLSDSLRGLKKASNIGSFTKLSNGISALSGALKGISTENTSKLMRLGNALKYFESAKDVKISPQLPQQLIMLSAGINEIKNGDAEKIQKIGDALKSLTYDGKANVAINGISSFTRFLETIDGKESSIQKVSTYLKDMASIDFTNIDVAAQWIRNIASSAKTIESVGGKNRGASKRIASEEEEGIAAGTGKIVDGEKIGFVRAKIKEITESIKEMNGTVMESRSIWKDFSLLLRSAIKDPTVEIEKSKKSLEGFNPIAYGLASVAQMISNAFKGMANGISKSTTSVGDSFKHISEFINNPKKAMSSLSDMFSKGMDNIVAKAKSVDPALGVIAAGFGSLASAAVSLAASIAGIVLDKLISALKRAASAALKFAISLPVKAVKSFGSAIKAAASGIAAYSKSILSIPFKRLGNSIQNVIKKLTSLHKSFARILLYRSIRRMIQMISQAFQEGTKNLYEYSKAVGTEFHNSMDSIATDALYIKNSLGTIAEPIVNALAPALRMLADEIANVIALVSQLLALLGGRSSYTRAVRGATEFAKATGGAAKAMEPFLASFDEINRIPSESGGGGGGGMEDVAGMFEEVEINSEVADFVQRIRDAFEAGDWHGLGTLLGDKFNEIVDSIPWTTIGNRLGSGINGFIQTAYAFLREADFRDLGSHFSEALMEMISQIDFETAGRLLVRSITSLIDIIIGFFTSDYFNPELIGQAVGDFINGGILEAQEWLSDQPWDTLGHNIGQMINSVFTHLNEVLREHTFGTFGQSMATLINNALGEIEFDEVAETLVRILTIIPDNIIEFFRGLEPDQVGIALSDFINGAIGELGKWLDSHKEDFPMIGQKIADILNKAMENIEPEEVAHTIVGAITSALDLIGAFLGGLDWDSIGSDVALFINTAIADAREWFDSKNWDEIRDNIYNVVRNSIEQLDMEDLGTLLWDMLKNGVSLTTSAFSGAFDGLRTAIGTEFALIEGEISGFNLALGAILALTGVSTPIGIALMALGAIGLVHSASEDWSSLESPVDAALATITGIVGGASLAVGAVLALTGVNIPLGIALIGVGALTLASSSAINWNALDGSVEKTVGEITTIVGGASLALGALLAFTGANIPIGIGLMVIGAASLGSAIALNWDSLSEETRATLANITSIVGGASLALGAILALTGAALPVGIALMALGAVGLVTGATLDKNKAADEVEEGFEQIGRSATDGFKQGIESGTDEGWFATHLVNPVVNWVKGLFGIHSPSTVFAEIGNNLTEGLHEGIEEEWPSIGQFFTEKFPDLAKTIHDGWENIKETASTKWEEIKENVSGKFDDIRDSASEKFDNVKSTISNTWDNIKNTGNSTWNNIKTNITTKWNDLKTSSASSFENIRKSISQAWNNTQNDATSKWGSIRTNVLSAWNGLATSASSDFNNIRETISGAWNTVQSVTSNAWNGMRSTISSVWSSISSQTASVAASVTSVVTTMANAVANAVSSIRDAFNNIKTAASNALNDITRSVSSIGTTVNNAGFSHVSGSFASGGFPAEGELFIARERGPELVGQINGRTAVANNSDIIGGIANGVADANGELISVAYAVAQQVVQAIQTSHSDVYIDSRKITQAQTRTARAMGV